MTGSGIVYILSRGDIIGLTLTLEASLLSFTSVFAMFLIMFRNIHRGMRDPEWRLLRDPMDFFMLLLFAADLVQAMGHILEIRWIHNGIVVEGPYCTAQGAIQQLGETGVAITTLVIAIHSFIRVWWRRGEHAFFAAKIIMSVVWLFIICIVAICFGIYRNKDYVIPSPYWCWLGSHYPMERLFGEYIWLWSTLVVSIITYILMFFCVRGNITPSDKTWWKFKVSWKAGAGADVDRGRILGFLAYPLIYAVIVLPISVVRWIGFHQERHGGKIHLSSAATIGLNVIYLLSGAFNVLLLLTTRRTDSLLLFRWKQDLNLGPRRVLSQGRLHNPPKLPRPGPCPQCGAIPLATSHQPGPPPPEPPSSSSDPHPQQV